MCDRVEAQRIREIDAAGPGVTGQVHAGIEGVLRILRAIRERTVAIDRVDTAIRREKTETRRRQ